MEVVNLLIAGASLVVAIVAGICIPLYLHRTSMSSQKSSRGKRRSEEKANGFLRRQGPELASHTTLGEVKETSSGGSA